MRPAQRYSEYIGNKLFETLWQPGLYLITDIRKTMRNYLVLLLDRLMLRKRFIIETVLVLSPKSKSLIHS